MRDYAQVRAGGVVTLEVAEAALDLYEVDALGLDRLDRGVIDVLCRRFGGGPVGVSTLAVAVGEERETVEEVAEPFLVRIGFLARTPRGRVATAAAWSHLGLAPPAGGEETLFGVEPRLSGRRRTAAMPCVTAARLHFRAAVPGPAPGGHPCRRTWRGPSWRPSPQSCPSWVWRSCSGC